MLDETKNIYVEKDIVVRLTPDEMIIMRLLIEKLETNSYLPMSEIERRIKRVKRRMIDRIIRGLRYKLQKTSIEINCLRGLGYYIEKKTETNMREEEMYAIEKINKEREKLEKHSIGEDAFHRAIDHIIYELLQGQYPTVAKMYEENSDRYWYDPIEISEEEFEELIKE
jgi:hypothetical protein